MRNSPIACIQASISLSLSQKGWFRIVFLKGLVRIDRWRAFESIASPRLGINLSSDRARTKRFQSRAVGTSRHLPSSKDHEFIESSALDVPRIFPPPSIPLAVVILPLPLTSNSFVVCSSNGGCLVTPFCC